VNISGWKAVAVVGLFALFVFWLLTPGGMGGVRRVGPIREGGSPLDAGGDPYSMSDIDVDDDDGDDDDTLYAGQDARSEAGGNKRRFFGAAAALKAIDEAYQAGFEAGKEGLEFGANKPAPPTPEDPGQDGRSRRPRRKRRPVNVDDIDAGSGGSSWASPPPGSSAARRSGLGGGMGISGMMTMLFVGQTVYSLGQNPGGGWSAATAIRNVQDPNAMPRWRLGILVIMLLRLVGISPF